MSPQQLQTPTIVEDVLTVLDRTGLNPHHLVLEVTESCIVDEQVAIPALVTIRSRGVRVAVDDFGTGYSSLHYLTRLPVDIVKIDQSLIRELNGTSEHAVIIEAIIHLGQVLHFTTVAEGVEPALKPTNYNSWAAAPAKDTSGLDPYLPTKPLRS